MSMGDFYGMKPGTIPGFADAGSGKFIGVEGLPRRTVTNMVAFMESCAECTGMTPSHSKCACGMSRPPSKTSARPKAGPTPGTLPLDSA
jgi:hypothetical protein